MSLFSGFEMCGIVIEDDKKRSGEMNADCEVMDIPKLVMDGELGDKNLLPELIPQVVDCDVKIDKLDRKVEK
jgi:hypothetical protein